MNSPVNMKLYHPSGNSSSPDSSSGSGTVRILFIADIFATPGMDIVTRLLPGIQRDRKIDFTIANGENCADGRGITVEQVNQLLNLNIDVITSGNHIWDKAPIRKEFKKLPKLLRPLNYPPGSGGRGSVLVETSFNIPVYVINLQGRTYLPSIDCPFRIMDRQLEKISRENTIIFIDFHAESTAEKIAMGWYLDGKVSAVVGTHTHVQTADERILPKGTGYITDAGMTGAFDSVIGMDMKTSIRRFLTQTPQPFQCAQNNIRINGVVVEIDKASNECTSIERLSVP